MRFPEKVDQNLIKTLKHLQDNLGRLMIMRCNRCLQTYLVSTACPTPERRQAIQALIATLQQRQRTERQQVEANFARFNSAATRTAFRKLFTREDEPA
ncbi:MAG: hypothetical protein R3E89_19385 [Thiolinea sp.]